MISKTCNLLTIIVGFFVMVEREKIGIVTDSGSMISPEEAARLDVEIVPLWICFDQQEFNDHQLTAAQVKKIFEETKVYPSTHGAIPSDLIVAYEKKLNLGANQIISIHIAKGIRSATFNAAKTAAKEVRIKHELSEDAINVFDSKQVALAVGFLVKEAVELISAGESFNKTISKLAQMRQKLNTIGTFSDLRWARKTAGIPSPLIEICQIIINNRLIPISPIIQIVNGDWRKKPLAVAKRGLAPKRIVELAFPPGSNVEKAGIFHFAAPEAAEEVAFWSKRLKPDVELEIAEVPASFAAGAGPGAVGISILEK